MNPQTKIEWEAWKKVVKCLMDLNIDINDKDDLCYAIKDWGVQFARLAKDFPNLLKKSDR